MKKINVLAMIAVTALAASVTWAAAPGGGGRGGRGGGTLGAPPADAPPARAGGNRGDVAPSNNPSAKSIIYAPTTPTAPPDKDGFIKRWSILEPITGVNGSNQNALHPNALKEYFPGQMTVIPKDGDKVTVNGAELKWHAIDSKLHYVNVVHFANDLGISSANDAMFWVVTTINCPEEMKDVRLGIGSNDGSVWWVNGQEACSIYGDILSMPDDAVSKRLTLKKGPNILRGVIHNQRGQVDFCARFLDDATGKAITNFTVSFSDK